MKGETPLHIAAYFANTAVAQVLLDSAGADVNARDGCGATPLDVLEARRLGQGQHLEDFKVVDDLERRTWKRRTEEMGQLLEEYGGLRGIELSNDLA